jgi:hypothetical protein
MLGAQDLFVRGLCVLLLCEVETVNLRQVGPLLLKDNEFLLQGVQSRVGNEGLARVVAPHDLVKVQLVLDAGQNAVARRMTQVVNV